MKTKEKTYLFVDGTNLYAGQYALFGPGKYLDFPKLITLIESKLNITFHKIYFYASYSPKTKKPTQKQKLYLKNEGLFYRSVQNTKKLTFFKGYRSPTSGKEKEVDVKLTADLVSMACLNKYTSVYLFTGDADFLQALFAIQPLKKKINILCFQNKIMFKGSYYFKTHLLEITPIKHTFQPHQKIGKINIQVENIITVIKKAPACMHAG